MVATGISDDPVPVSRKNTNDRGGNNALNKYKILIRIIESKMGLCPIQLSGVWYPTATVTDFDDDQYPSPDA